jgi:hypothetical protein
MQYNSCGNNKQDWDYNCCWRNDDGKHNWDCNTTTTEESYQATRVSVVFVNLFCNYPK